MHDVTSHIINPANDRIRIKAIDEPGAGGACHEYLVGGFSGDPLLVKFQNGPINEVGVNGVTQEALLAIVIDRLQSFQKGPFSCRENSLALTKAEEALHWLQQRTLDRMRRGVEGQTKA